MSVFWTRGYRNDGGAIQMGLVVVRPGWVAFLPLGVPMGPSEQFALGAARTRGGGAVLRMDVPWQGRYPIMAWYQHGGLDVLDFEVRRALEQHGAAMFTNAEAGFVSRKYSTAFVPFAPGIPMLTLDQAPPPGLVAMWRPGVLPLDRKKLNATVAIICAISVLSGAGCQALIYSVEGYWSLFPVFFFGIFVVVALYAYRRRVREHDEDLRRQANPEVVGPYR
jgi:hypothetical protein